MALGYLTSKVCQDLAAFARKVGVRRAAAQAGNETTVVAVDQLVLNGLKRDPVAHIATLNRDLARRAPDMLARKYENMAISPRRFLTGQPELMAHDMRAVAAKMGADTVLVADMHCFNFGTMFTAKGKVKVRPNDFDLAAIGPAALDFNRLATHVQLVGEENRLGRKQSRNAVRALAESYYDTMAALAATPGGKVKLESPKAVRDLLAAAKNEDPVAWVNRRAPKTKGVRRLERFETRIDVSKDTATAVTSAFEAYRAKLPSAARQELAGMSVTDVVAALDGTGSVGQARFRLLLEGKDKMPVILQFKEQGASALEGLLPIPLPFASHADRNVSLSHLMDGGLDPMRAAATVPGLPGSFLVERVRATDKSIHVEDLADATTLRDVAAYYGGVAAKGHARGAAAGLAGPQDILAMLGPRKDFVTALVDFATDYAAQVERDFKAFKQALKRDPLLANLKR